MARQRKNSQTIWISVAIVTTMVIIGTSVFTGLLIRTSMSREMKQVLLTPEDDYFMLVGSRTGRPQFSAEDADYLQQHVPGVPHVAMARAGWGLREGQSAAPVWVMSVEPGFFAIRNLYIQDGRLFDQADQGDGAVLGASLASALGLSAGSIFTYPGIVGSYRVVGVLKPVEDDTPMEDYSNFHVNDTFYVPFETIPRALDSRTNKELIQVHDSRVELVRLLVGVEPGYSVSDVAAAAKALLEQHTDQHIGIETGPSSRTIHEYVTGRSEASLLPVTLLLALAGLVNVSALIMMHTFLHAKEIGIKRACGATRMRIWQEYLFRYAGLSLISTTLALLMSRLLAPLVMSYLEIRPKWDLSIMTLGALFLISNGPLCAAWPASIAAALSPVDTIRDRVAWGAGRRRVDLRQGLVAIAFGLSIGVVFFTVSFGLSSVMQIDRYLRAIGSEMIIVEEPPLGSVAPIPELRIEDYQAMVASLSPDQGQVTWMASAAGVAQGPSGDYQRVTVTGTAGDTLTVRDFFLREGQWHLGAGQTVIGAKVAERLFGNESPLGKTIRLGDRGVEFTVTGVLGPRPSAVSDYDRDRDVSVFIGWEDAALIAAPASFTKTMYIQAKDDQTMDTLVATAKDTLTKSNPHGGRLVVRRPTESLSQARRLRSSFHLSMMLMGMLSIMTTCAGITAMALVQTKEMERTIAITRACGASKSQIQVMVLGGLLGVVVVAATLGIGIAFFLYQMAARIQQLPRVNALGGIFGALALSTLAAFLAAYVPAKRAAERPPASLF